MILVFILIINLTGVANMVPKVSTNELAKFAIGGIVGAAAFGVMLYLIRKAPTNAVTSPVKKVADIASTR